MRSQGSPPLADDALRPRASAVSVVVLPVPACAMTRTRRPRAADAQLAGRHSATARWSLVRSGIFATFAAASADSRAAQRAWPQAPFGVRPRSSPISTHSPQGHRDRRVALKPPGC